MLLLLLAAVTLAGTPMTINDQAIRRDLKSALKRAHDDAPDLRQLLAEPVPLPDGFSLEKTRRRVLDPVQIRELLEQSALVHALVYECEKCGKLHRLRTASAFAIAPGVAVTNHHVIDHDGQAGMVMSRDEHIYSVTGVIAADAETDLALLRVDGLPGPGLPLATGLPEAGEPVFVLSHPANHYFSFSEGMVTRTAVKWTGKGRIVNISAPFARGSSGAAVVDRAGNVVSIVHSTLSVAPSEEHEEQTQMVFGNTIPVDDLVQLIKQASSR